MSKVEEVEVVEVEEGTQEVSKVCIDLEEAKHFMSLVDVIMIGDPRGDSVKQHYANMINKALPKQD